MYIYMYVYIYMYIYIYICMYICIYITKQFTLHSTEAYSEPFPTSKRGGYLSLEVTISKKKLHLDV